MYDYFNLIVALNRLIIYYNIYTLVLRYSNVYFLS